MVFVLSLTNTYESSAHKVGKPVFPCLKTKNYVPMSYHNVNMGYLYIYFKSYSQVNKSLYTYNFLHEIVIQNLRWPSKMWRVCLTCAHATNQQEMRISYVHEVNSSKTQLLSMSHKWIRRNQMICIKKYITVFSSLPVLLPFWAKCATILRPVVYTFH